MTKIDRDYDADFVADAHWYDYIPSAAAVVLLFVPMLIIAMVGNLFRFGLYLYLVIRGRN